MRTNSNILHMMAGVALTFAVTAGAQAPATPAPATTPAPAAAPAAPTWSVGPMDISGFIDGYYSYNYNRPSDTSDSGQVNQLYNFNDKTDQFNLSAAKLTLNHDPDPVGAHIDLLFGRTNTLVNDSGGSGASSGKNQGNYVEQAYISLKPPTAKGWSWTSASLLLRPARK